MDTWAKTFLHELGPSCGMPDKYIEHTDKPAIVDKLTDGKEEPNGNSKVSGGTGSSDTNVIQGTCPKNPRKRRIIEGGDNNKTALDGSNVKYLIPSQLSEKSMCIYQLILKVCKDDEGLSVIKRLTTNSPFTKPGDQKDDVKKLSGRSLDAMVTELVNKNTLEPTYLVNIHNGNIIELPRKNGQRYTDPSVTASIAATGPGDDNENLSGYQYFNVAASYRRMMAQYSKTYFDCFARGDVVIHRSENNTVFNIALAQYMFFIWAKKYGVFEYLRQKHSTNLYR